ncbi:glutathione S-transferase T1-like [Amaranthus tricolor]|uniref:glutathione S-transferase T1-like n=1 Tax=Amaranthus tricolor TaxID=29722 RepID=UPI00258CB515|nr:glutathione S-transferase T1-like [Amaranthus tricolor]
MATGDLLKIYADRLSQPSRAVIIFSQVNGIQFEEQKIKLFSPDVQKPDFIAANPLKKVPAISHGNFTLFESHAILTYLACWFLVPDHWYPSDLRKRAKIQSVLDWHHSNLRYGSTRYLMNTVLAPFLGKKPNLEAAAEYELKLGEAFSTIETLWLKDDSKFLLGNVQPSVADLSLVCETMQLHMLPEEDTKRILGPHKKIQQWVENVREATNPHFDEVHKHLFDTIAIFYKKA